MTASYVCPVCQFVVVIKNLANAEKFLAGSLEWREPHAGDCFVCSGCASYLKFEPNEGGRLTLGVMTLAEIGGLEDKDRLLLQRLRRAILLHLAIHGKPEVSPPKASAGETFSEPGVGFVK